MYEKDTRLKVAGSGLGNVACLRGLGSSLWSRLRSIPQILLLGPNVKGQQTKGSVSDGDSRYKRASPAVLVSHLDLIPLVKVSQLLSLTSVDQEKNTPFMKVEREKLCQSVI